MNFSGFYKLSVEQRLSAIKEYAGLSEEEVSILRKGLGVKRADKMVENVVSTFTLPLGFAVNFVINGVERVVPMAIEEPSVIAAASKAAKMALPKGFSAKAVGSEMIGQVQLIGDAGKAIALLEKAKEEIGERAAKATERMARHGGGFRECWFRKVKTGIGEMAIAEFAIDVADSMGANTINTAMEEIAPFLEEVSGAKARLRILTNLALRRMVEATAYWEVDPEPIIEAYELAKHDIFRAATHNKGIMNGIDAVAIATGNDWRAVEASAHAYASMDGYTSLTSYEREGSGIRGRIRLPLAVATVGGTISANPVAQVNLKILKVSKAKELAEVMASVGLAQNFAAIYALSTEGIQKGHMKLHARSVALSAGASPEEAEGVAEELVKLKAVSVEKAKEILAKMRSKK
ncbi:MAG: hydroxymethylglutaryl-CoA reductase, degradative [Candidatus Anstonellales archaeon]